jgi:hypothetical protein
MGDAATDHRLMDCLAKTIDKWSAVYLAIHVGDKVEVVPNPVAGKHVPDLVLEAKLLDQAKHHYGRRPQVQGLPT